MQTARSEGGFSTIFKPPSAHRYSTQAYIEFMRPRCVELAWVFKKTGSFYCHCDWHASH
jgi:hypothetical protein